MDNRADDQIKIKRLEAALINYIERYGMSDSAREALAQVEAISHRTAGGPDFGLVRTECGDQLNKVAEQAANK